MASNDLTKLTVPQLKALCKDRRITGYSKLTKNALILKLTESHTNATAQAVVPPAPGVASLANDQNRTSLPTLCSAVQNSILHPAKKQKRTADDSLRVASRAQLLDQVITTSGSENRIYESPSTAVPNVDSNPPTDVPSVPAVSHNTSLMQSHLSTTVLPQKTKEMPMSLATGSVTLGGPPAVLNTTPLSSTTSGVTKNNKRPRSSVTKTLPTKKPKNAALSKVHPLNGLIPERYPSNALEHPLVKQARQSTGTENTPPSLTTLPSRDRLGVPVPSSVHPLQSTRDDTRAMRHNGAKFKPLIVNRATTNNPPGTLSGTVPNAAVCSSDPNGQVTFSYLEFPFSSPVKLSTITLPPSLSQRKRIPQWSVILSGVSDEDFGACIQVSRMFRYAIYLSAAHRLNRSFCGRRLALMNLEYVQSMTNMWPYLHLRQREMMVRRQIYDRSFLPKYFLGRNPISERLWTSPDHERQITVAVRFVLTRLWFHLSIGGGEDPRYWKVVDAQQLVEGEIWSIAFTSPSNILETLYVLEATCEPIGYPQATSRPTEDSPRVVHPSIPVRADWCDYIATRLLPASSLDAPPLSLLEYLKWTNHEEYDKGISRLWLKRIGSEGASGFAKRRVAERYVLACVVGNSLSGSWMSSAQMAQEFAGLPSLSVPAKSKLPRVTLFLPSHHHVESVHFTTAKGIALHAALAVVQTPGREYYILRDNGMVVGCEEDGVGVVWMELLGCSILGSESTSSFKS